MKKFLVVFVFLFSLGMTAQTLTDKEVVKTVISKGDLPLGASFAMLILDGSPMVTGKVDKDLLFRLPIGRTFILSVNSKVTKYNLVPLPPPRKVSLINYNIKNINSYLKQRRNTFIRKQKLVMC